MSTVWYIIFSSSFLLFFICVLHVVFTIDTCFRKELKLSVFPNEKVCALCVVGTAVSYGTEMKSGFGQD
jgi:hypothetical protein